MILELQRVVREINKQKYNKYFCLMFNNYASTLTAVPATTQNCSNSLHTF